MKILNPYDRTTKQVRDADSSPRSGKVKGKAQAKPQTPPPQGDRVELSELSRLAEQAKEVVAKTPEVRVERVEALKERVDSGTYEVDSEKVAAKLVDEHLSELI